MNTMEKRGMWRDNNRDNIKVIYDSINHINNYNLNSKGIIKI